MSRKYLHTAMFGKDVRLTKASQFEQVLKHPEINLSSGPLRLRARTNRMSRARLGLVVPKRGTRTAVRRNRIKRIVREWFRKAGPELPPLDMVVQVYRDLDDNRLAAALSQVQTEIQNVKLESL